MKSKQNTFIKWTGTVLLFTIGLYTVGVLAFSDSSSSLQIADAGYPVSEDTPPLKRITATFLPPRPTATNFPTPITTIFSTPNFKFPSNRADGIPTELHRLLYVHDPSTSRNDEVYYVTQLDLYGNYWGEEPYKKTDQNPHGIPFIGSSTHEGHGVLEFTVSPDEKWLVVQHIHKPTDLINLETSKAQTIFQDIPIVSYLSWGDKSSTILVRTENGIKYYDLNTQTYRSIEPQYKIKDPSNPLFSSKDGETLVEIQTSKTDSNDWITEIFISPYLENRAPIELQNVFHVYPPKWSTNNNAILFVTSVMETNQNYLWIFTIETQEFILLNTDVHLSTVTWSPNSELFAYVKNEGTKQAPNTNIVLVNPTTRETTQLTQFENQDIRHLSWSPDGKWIAFDYKNQQDQIGYEIWMVNIDSLEIIPIAGPTVENMPFIWLP